MSEQRTGRRGGGRAARQAARANAVAERVPFLTRTMTPFEVLSEEGLETIEHNADTILETGRHRLPRRARRAELLAGAGAEVDGERVRFPRGMCRSIIAESAPASFTQVARNPANNVEIGGMHTVLAPCYGTPFVRDLDEGRRYGTIEDFRNIVKMTYASPYLHHSGGTVCEPVDLPVNKRHYDMVYAHMRYSDKPFMGSVTHPLRAQDTVEMCRILFGAETLEDADRRDQPHQRELAARVGLGDARRGEGLRRGEPGGHHDAVHPRRRDEPGDGRRRRDADARRVDGRDGLRPARAPGRAGRVRLVRLVDVDAVGRADVRNAGARARCSTCCAALARRLGVPFRSGGSLCASKVADAQAAYESANTLQPTMLGGVNFVLHAAGWLEGGLAFGYEKFVMDADQCGMVAEFVKGVDLSENGQALDAIIENGPGQHFLGSAHTLANFETAFYRSEIADNNSFEQWEIEGSKDAAQRANAVWKKMLAEYEAPPIDEARDEELREWIERKKASFPDSNV